MSDIRLDQIGAMKRPPWLLDVFKRHKVGEATDQELREAQDRSIRELVARQDVAGMPVVTDGEHRRRVFMQSFTDSVSGLTEGNYLGNSTVAAARLRKTGNRPLDEFRFVKPLTRGLVKTTFLSPLRMLQTFDPVASHGAYVDAAAFEADVLDISRQIVSELVAEGCRYASIDAPFYTWTMDRVEREAMMAEGKGGGALVSTKLAQVEDADHLKRRIDEAAKYLPLEQLALSAACGFGGSPDAVHQLMTEDDQWRKIEVMRKVAEDVWR